MELPEPYHCRLSFKALSVSVSVGAGLWCVHLSAAPLAAAVHKIFLNPESGPSSRQKMLVAQKQALCNRSAPHGASTCNPSTGGRQRSSQSQSTSACHVRTTSSSGQAVRSRTFARRLCWLLGSPWSVWKRSHWYGHVSCAIPTGGGAAVPLMSCQRMSGCRDGAFALLR